MPRYGYGQPPQFFRVALNPSDQAGFPLKFTNGNRTVENLDAGFSGTWGFARSTHGSRRPFYYEFLISSATTANVETMVLLPPGRDIANSMSVAPNRGIVIGGGGSYYSDNLSVYSSFGTTANGDRVCVAVNQVSMLLWARVNGGNWNNSGTDNPATNTGGINISSMISPQDNELWVSAQSHFPGAIVTVYFDRNEWAQTPPAGYDQIRPSDDLRYRVPRANSLPAISTLYFQQTGYQIWPSGAGGTVYNVSVAETITSIVDAVTAALTLSVSMPESMAATDATTGLAIFPRTVAETMGATDTQTGVGVFPRTVAETVSATTDTQTAAMTLVASMPESIATSDAPSAALTMPATVTESLGTTDSPSSVLTAVGSVAETMGASDSPSATALLNVTLAESVAITDSQTGLMTMAASVAESLAATDALTGGLLFAVTVAESAAASDSQTGLLTMLCDRAEIMGVADSPSATAAFVLSVAETAGVSDSITGLLTIAATVAESIASADTPFGGNIFAVTTDEAASVTDAASLQVTLAGSVAEAVAIADACNAQLVAVAAVVESASILDQQSEDGPPPPGTDEYRVGGGGVKDIIQTLNVATIHHTQKKTGPS